MNNKLKVLTKIANKINSRNIVWAVGGSTLLFLRGIVDHFNETDIEQLKNLLLELGILEAPNPHKDFKTRYFLEFLIDDIEVDVMAGFIIVNNNKEYYFPLEKSKELEFLEVNGVNIPLQSIEEWKKYYELMGRTDKVRIINSKAL